MALRWSIYFPPPQDMGMFASPNPGTPYRPPSPYASEIINFATEAEAVAYFVANYVDILGVYSALQTPLSISYPNKLIYGYPDTQEYVQESFYFPSYGGFYTQYDYTVVWQQYSFRMRTTRFPASEGFPLNVYISQQPEVGAPPTPPDVTIQLKRDGGVEGTYSVQPGSEAVLIKYATPVKQIRAKFQTTRVAVIEDTVDGGFMIYEEVASVPSGPVYVYNGERKLTEVVDAAYIAQYRAI